MAPNIDTPNRLLSGYTHDEGGYEEVPRGFGLCIRLNALDGSVSMESVADQHCTEIHPNCYAPESLQDIRLLHGGGSGTAVFHGADDDLGSIVMKHGGPKDTKEVFSLAIITQELVKRAILSPEAAGKMRERIPRFVMVYLSPYHLRDRGKELWASLRGSFWSNMDHGSWSSLGSQRGGAFGSQRGSLINNHRRTSVGNQKEAFVECRTKNSPRSPLGASEREIYHMSRETVMQRFSPHTLASDGIHGMRTIRIRRSIEEDTDNDNSSSNFDCQRVFMDAGLTAVELEIPHQFFDRENSSKIINGATFLRQLMEELVELQEENNWKVTLAQSSIGGDHPLNGADILTNGLLNEALRNQLVNEFVSIMKDLRKLTFPDERNVVKQIRKEVQTLAVTQDVSTVSRDADAFVGSAVRKNFHPINGRFTKMRAIGREFRSEKMHLVTEEEVPAKFVGQVLLKGVKLSTLFIDPPCEDQVLDLLENEWLSLLQLATSLQTPAATDCVWTCGLTDAGLHNTFLSKTRGLELFDLGAPVKMPQPAFLTKFLMSFFHTAGMQPDGLGSWVCRFELAGGRLALTPDTLDILPYLNTTFSLVLRRLVDELFEGDKEVEQLLVKYVSVQLLSDAAFCLNRWEQKGGGDDVRHTKSSRELSKWLWRSLWDFYIASHVHSTFSKTQT